jgi:hypothetical protein
VVEFRPGADEVVNTSKCSWTKRLRAGSTHRLDMTKRVADDGPMQVRSSMWLLALAVGAVAGCAMPGQTFEPGVEHMPGPASFVVAIEPPFAVDRSIELLMDATVTRTFLAERGESRFLTGLSLPANLTARVGGQVCEGAIGIAEDMEADATLSVLADGCDLRLDLLHRMGTIDHSLDDSTP